MWGDKEWSKGVNGVKKNAGEYMRSEGRWSISQREMMISRGVNGLFLPFDLSQLRNLRVYLDLHGEESFHLHSSLTATHENMSKIICDEYLMMEQWSEETVISW